MPDRGEDLECTLRLGCSPLLGAGSHVPLDHMGTGFPAEGFLRHRGLILTAAGGAVVEGGLLTLLAPNARRSRRRSPRFRRSPPTTTCAGCSPIPSPSCGSAAWSRRSWSHGLPLTRRCSGSPGRGACRREEQPRVRVLRGADGAGLGAAAARGNAGVRRRGVAVLVAVPRRVPDHARHRRGAQPGGLIRPGGGGCCRPARCCGCRQLRGGDRRRRGDHAPATGAALVVAAVTGLVNARAWYGLAVLAARMQPRPHESVPAKMLFSLPFAPIAAVMVLALVVGVARLLFTGTIQLPISPESKPRGGRSGRSRPAGAPRGTQAAASRAAAVVSATASAVLVVGGGDRELDAANGLRTMVPGTPVWQFSYVGLNTQGRPVPSGASADDLPLPELGDRIAAQVRALHADSGGQSPSSRRARGRWRLRDARARSRAARLLGGAAQPDRQPRAAYLPAGPGRRVGLRGRPRRAEPPGRGDVAVRPERCAAPARASRGRARYFEDMVAAAGGGAGASPSGGSPSFRSPTPSRFPTAGCRPA